jgi:hypothetical protein
MGISPKKLLLALHIILTAVIFWARKGTPTISWMYIFSYEDIKTWSDFSTFVMGLRTGMCPYLAFTEIIWSWVFGDLELYRRWIYFLLAITAFSIPVIVAMTIGFRTQIVTSLLCLIFSIGVAQTHQCNPQIYDLLYPTLVFSVILLLQKSANFLNAFLAGLALGLLELTRPFVLLMLPLLLLVAYLKLQPTKKFVVFLLPLILTSGLWHLKLFFFNNGQIVWTNSTGFNLATVWISGVSLSEFSEEPPLKPYLWQNLNTGLHQQNSQRLKRMVFSSWMQDPVRFLKISLIRIYEGGRDITSLYQCLPKHWSLPFYKIVATTIYVVSFIAIACWAIFSVYIKRINILLNPIFLILFVGCLTAVFNAIGQRYEEARLIVSCLPTFALLPSLCAEFFRLRQNTQFI